MNDDQLSAAEHDAMRSRLMAGTKRIKPAGAHRRAIITSTVAVVLVAGLAGTAIGAANVLRMGEATEPISTPTSTPTPTATRSATPSLTPTATAAPPERVVTAPSSRFAFDCDDVAADVAVFFDGQVPPVASALPRSAGGASWVAGPAQFAFAQAGALYCEYGTSGMGSTGWATVTLVPDAAGAVEDRQQTLGSGDSCEGGSPCELFDGAFVEVVGQPRTGFDDPALQTAAGSTAVEAVRERVRGSQISPRSWTPPTGTSPVSGDCSAVLPTTRLEATLGVSGIETGNPDGGWSIKAWMISDFWGATPCFYREGGADLWTAADYGSVTWLPGGEWAYREAVSGEQIPLPGSAPTDAATALCQPDELNACIVDVLADGNWVRYTMPISVPENDRSRVAAEVASAIIDTVGS